MRIGIDLMGGDAPPETLFPAVFQASSSLAASDLLVVIATKPVAKKFLAALPPLQERIGQAAIEVCTVAETISMGDEPLRAVRRKTGSSMLIGLRLVKKKAIDALVSCGNTGALVAGAALTLPALSSIRRPALLALLPTVKGTAAVIDVGGNVSCKAEDLVQYAKLGADYQRTMEGIEAPVVGLLNIGVERHKGTAEVRRAYELLRAYCSDAVSRGIAPPFHFAGNIEGRELFAGAVDVVVTDGFTGNVLLKTAEGVAGFIFDALEDGRMSEAEGVMSRRFKDLKTQFSYAEYPGAIVCGVEGIVFKVHGNAAAASLVASIFAAVECVRKLSRQSN